MLAEGSDDDNRLIYETKKFVGHCQSGGNLTLMVQQLCHGCWLRHWHVFLGNFTINPDAVLKERCSTENDDNATDSVVTVVDFLSAWHVVLGTDGPSYSNWFASTSLVRDLHFRAGLTSAELASPVIRHYRSARHYKTGNDTFPFLNFDTMFIQAIITLPAMPYNISTRETWTVFTRILILCRQFEICVCILFGTH
jgi:hypothetical protein